MPVSTAQLDLFGPPVAAVRKADPRTSRLAAATGRGQREEQWKQILRLLGHGPASADSAARVIRKHRSVASSRIGVMMNERGLCEPDGEHLEPDDDGHERLVLRYRLTAHGAEVLAQLDAAAAP